MKSLKDLFFNELADTYDAERRLVKTLRKFAQAAGDGRLRAMFLAHLGETQQHVEKLERVFESLGVWSRGKRCEAAVGILKEGDDLAMYFQGSPAIDAALIAAARKIEHFEIASYGSLREWAEFLGYSVASGLLSEILAEKTMANSALIMLARSANPPAAAAETEATSTVGSYQPKAVVRRRAVMRLRKRPVGDELVAA